MIALPNDMGQKIGIFCYDLNWGRRVFDSLKNQYWDIGVEYCMENEVKFKDGTVIWLIHTSPEGLSCGRRCHIVMMQSEIHADVREECILPMACLGKGRAYVWHNEKWFWYHEIFPRPRNYVKEAEEWLRSL